MLKRIKDRSSIYYACFLIAVYIVLGLAVTLSCNYYFFSQQKNILLSHVERIGNIIGGEFTEDGSFIVEKFHEDMTNMVKYSGASFSVTGPNMRLYFVSDKGFENLGFLEGADFKSLEGSDIYELKGDLGLFNKDIYAVGKSFEYGDMLFYVFASEQLSVIQMNVIYASIIILTSLFVAILIGYYLVMIAIEKSHKPIIEMNSVAKAMAKGDFDKRVEIYGSGDVSELCENFNKMAESLSRENEFKNEYISNISHDIRSPLTTIKGFVEAMMDGTIPPEKTRHYLEIVYNEADRLSNLGSSLLELSKMDLNDKTLNIESIDLISFLIDCVESMEDKCRQKDLHIEYSFAQSRIYILADLAKLQRICYNLVDNAIKYTDNGGHITIYAAIKDDKKAIIAIEDDGIGISEENQKHIFERLYKVDKSRGKDKTSVGLGLAIVKEMLEAHGESISVKSELGKGTRFTFEMPLDID